MAMCVLSWPDLRSMTSLGPSTSDHYLMKMMEDLSWASVDIAAQDLRREHRFRHPVRL
jgi:hypothetical protein